MKVKVWNKNVHPYKEKFRDEWITIGAGQFVWMEEDQANLFRGTMGSVPLLDADGNKIPEGFKMIVLEYPKSADHGVETASHNCQACGLGLGSESDLDDHIKEKHANLLTVKDELAENSLRNKQKAFTK